MTRLDRNRARSALANEDVACMTIASAALRCASRLTEELNDTPAYSSVLTLALAVGEAFYPAGLFGFLRKR